VNEKVELTWQEMLLGATHGVYRRIVNTKAKNKDKRGKWALDVWSQDIEGALSEIALAKWLGVYWSGASFVRADDVIGYEVRWTHWDNGHLPLHRSDIDEKRYVLVTGGLGKYVIRGWIYARDGKREELWGEFKGAPEGACYKVPQSELMEIPRP
jgi:hypothetical protein